MRRILVGVVVVLLLAAGASMLPIWPETPERPAADHRGVVAQRPPEKRPVAPVLAGSTLDDEPVSVPDGRPAVLFFFTVGCGTCFPGAQELVEARGEAGDTADYVAVDLDLREPPAVVKKFFTAAGDEDFPVVLDEGMTMGAKFRVESLGTLIVINREGRETYRKVDPSAGEIVNAVRDASAA